MSITFRILGHPGGDNALWVQIDTGQSVDRLLFDCGEGCVSELPFGEVREIDHLFFSHLHMDHVAGFDAFFRANFERTTKPNRIWGPPQTAQILQHRFQGYLWNLHEGLAATWRVTDVEPRTMRTTRFELGEAFATAHEEGTQPHQSVIWDAPGYTVEAMTMNHRTSTLAYVVREKARRNIDTARLAALGLRPGAWLKELKEAPRDSGDSGSVTIDGIAHSMADLRERLIVETPGDAIAFLTDFLLDEPALEHMADALRGCRVMICEGQYRHADIDLARKHFHMTTALSATLAQRAQVQELVLLHLSSRYERAEWVEMLEEARQVFPNTHFPAQWGLDTGEAPAEARRERQI